MLERILDFVAPRDRWELLRLMLLLMLAVYVTSSCFTLIVFPLVYPEIMPMIDTQYFLALALIVVLVTGPFGSLLMLAGLRLNELNQRLTYISSTDMLTGLSCRRAFLDGARKHIQSGNLPGALLLIDADNFKTLNDTHGHQTGDLALMVIAMHLKDCIREGDLVGRIGGEEFGVFLPGVSGRLAAEIAERIRAQISEDVIVTEDEGIGVRFSVSVGGVHVPRPASFDHCFRVADQSLYAAKEAGRNRVVFAPGEPELTLNAIAG